MIFLPLLFVGPLIGGFLASYISKGYEDYDTMDLTDGAVIGAISGLVGGLALTLLFIWFGSLNAILESFIGDNVTILVYAILQITTILSFVLGMFGGVVGVTVKR